MFGRWRNELIAVRLESGLVVWHTREQYEALWRGVDREATRAMSEPIEGGENASERTFGVDQDPE